MMTSLLVVWLAKQILGALLSQQIKGSIPDYTMGKAIAAARLLPPELAKSYLEDWLAELDTLERKPMTALRYARGLAAAARTIAILADAPLIEDTRLRRAGNRLFDVAMSAVLLILLAPMLSTIALVAALCRGPILFRRVRLGREDEPIVQLMFFTNQWRGDGSDGSNLLGGLLRRTSLDRLPVFFNVLRGDMSIIGPPARREAEPLLRRPPLKVRPGLVGWETLVELGCVKLPISEARVRDQQRSVKRDLALLVRCAGMLFIPEDDLPPSDDRPRQ
jgi:lipopolysaccharide/colanic/teichoic acid biosynthesis glycosyltransferase